MVDLKTDLAVERVDDPEEAQQHSAALAVAYRVDTGIVERGELVERLEMLGLLETEMVRQRAKQPNVLA